MSLFLHTQLQSHLSNMAKFTFLIEQMTKRPSQTDLQTDFPTNQIISMVVIQFLP